MTALPTAPTIKPDPTSEQLVFAPSHAAVYQIRCNHCDALTVFNVDIDSVRMVCPNCKCRLTLPATVRAACQSCGSIAEYPHTLAGHSTTCAKCHYPVLIGPVAGRAERFRPVHRHRRKRRPGPGRTLAFNEGAERALILIAAAIGTLIFVVVIGMR